MALIHLACCVASFVNHQTALHSDGIQTYYSRGKGRRQRLVHKKGNMNLVIKS